MIVLYTGIFLIIVTLLMSKKYTPWIGFAFVFLIMGFQSNVQGDYYGYMDSFNYSQSTGNMDARTIDREPFHPFLMLLFSWGSWWLFVMLTTFFEIYVLERFVSRYCTKKYLYFAAILFFFTFNMMLLQMKAMRQGLAIEMMILAFILMDNVGNSKLHRKNKNLTYLSICIAICAYLTHNTSLVLQPFLILFWFVTRNPEKLECIGKGKFFPWIILGIYAFFYVVKDVFLKDYLSQISLLVGGKDFGYSGYFDGSNLNESFIYMEVVTPPYLVAFNAVMVFLVAKTFQVSNARIRLFCIVSILACIGDIIFFNLGSLPRIVMYFSVFNLVVYPHVAMFVEKSYNRVFAICLLLITLVVVARTSIPWMIETELDRFGNYHFIFAE